MDPYFYVIDACVNAPLKLHCNPKPHVTRRPLTSRGGFRFVHSNTQVQQGKAR